ncbi:hypothetical protein OPT61_g7584 [Boeremia exigua]|uniref:Uncharacterized protein n=1 Tax=Boeremia exigua TaxID=749465 RepID=A0ACC2I201_9PLEO|nr:hypothetical protein OPT61_g7584 [Boeremia exigua]
MTKDRFRAKRTARNQSHKWQAVSEREDDQIAPKAAASSIDTLQRWAHATANIEQGGVRANEIQTMERIHDRYGIEGFSPSHSEDADLYAEETHADTELEVTTSQKRKQPMSPTRSIQSGTMYEPRGAEVNRR